MIMNINFGRHHLGSSAPMNEANIPSTWFSSKFMASKFRSKTSEYKPSDRKKNHESCNFGRAFMLSNLDLAISPSSEFHESLN